MIRIALAAAVLLAAVPVEAAETIPGPVACDVVSVYDGDTFTAECRPWPQIEATVSVRVHGIDTPEIRGKCEAEKRQAIQARDYVRSVTGNGVVLRSIFLGKYAGRVVADVFIGADNLADLLIGRGLGRPYEGGSRAGWCG